MPVLADRISVRGRFSRSANLERDVARLEPLDGYVLTARGLDVVERIATTAVNGSAGGAWSITGPYGSGKSSLALLLDAAFSGACKLRTRALQVISKASASAYSLVRRAHEQHDTHGHGFSRALVTARREPLARTIARALHSAVVRSDAPPPAALIL